MNLSRDPRWARFAAQSARNAGYAETPCPLEGQPFSLPGEVAPCVQVFVRRVTFNEVAPEAFIGVYLEAFERGWRDRLIRTGLDPKHQTPTFGLHIANVLRLGLTPWAPNAPSDQDVAAVKDWLDRVFDYAKRLPSSLDSLVAAINANKIADHNVEAYLGHPVKVRGFVQWLRREHGIDIGDRLLPLLSDRTEPYDVRAMLGPD